MVSRTNVYRILSDKSFFLAILLKWLNRLQFKIGQIETQSSHAAQFYSL